MNLNESVQGMKMNRFAEFIMKQNELKSKWINAVIQNELNDLRYRNTPNQNESNQLICVKAVSQNKFI